MGNGGGGGGDASARGEGLGNETDARVGPGRVVYVIMRLAFCIDERIAKILEPGSKFDTAGGSGKGLSC